LSFNDCFICLEFDSMEEKFVADTRLDNFKTESEIDAQKVLLSTDWSKWHEIKISSSDDEKENFCFAEWREIKEQLYDVFNSYQVVGIIFTYIQKWALLYKSHYQESSQPVNWGATTDLFACLDENTIEIAALEPCQEIEQAEIWKLAFKWSSEIMERVVIGFAQSDGNFVGLGSDGYVRNTCNVEEDKSTEEWSNGDVVVMVLDTQKQEVTFQVGLKVVAKKLDLEEESFPLEVCFWMASDDKIPKEINVEVLDGLCVNRDVIQLQDLET